MGNTLDQTRLRQQAAACGIVLTEQQAARLGRYAQELAQWNEKMNLTAITDPAEVEVKHFVDSLTVLPLLPDGAFRLIDVGTGAGFPGVPLAIARPDVSVILVEPLLRRTTFLDEVVADLGLSNVTVLRGRAEEKAVRKEVGLVDVVTSRAVAPLGKLAGWSLPLVKTGGHMIAMKGSSAAEEIERDAKQIRKSKGESPRIVEVGKGLLDTPTYVVEIRKN